MASPQAERITVGLVRGLHGLRGAVRVEILSDDPDRFSVGSVVYAEGDDHPLTVTWVQPSKPGLLIRFEEATSREAVEGLRNRYLEADPGERLPDGVWYWHQVEGLEATSLSGEQLGTVSEVMRVAEAEVYIIRGGPRGEIMVPAVRGIVADLSPPDGRLVIDIDALGLPDEPPAPRPPRPPRPERPRRVKRARVPRSPT